MLHLLWALVGVENLVTLALFGFDKWRARRPGARRIPERTLLWSMLLGGCIAGWLGMQWFRHKTQKAPFRRWAVVWTIVNPLWWLVVETWRALPG